MANAKQKLLPIGVHVTRDAAYLVQLAQGDGRARVVSKAAKTFETAAETAARVAALENGSGGSAPPARPADYARARQFVQRTIASDGFRGRDVVINLPAEQLVIQHARLAPMPAEELATALPFEVQEKLPFDPKQAVLRHIVAGSLTENNETRQDVLVLAAEKQAVEGHVTMFSRMGLNVVGVGIEPCAMCYGYAFAACHGAATQSGPPCLMVVHLGGWRTDVAILRGQDVTFVKEVACGTDHLVQAIARARSLSAEEAAATAARWRESPTETLQEAVDTYNRIRSRLGHLVDELESCMRYHASLARGATIDRLCFVGPGARDLALVRVLGATMRVPCDVGDPLGAVSGPDGAAAAEPDLAVAVGLSLFGAQ